MMKRKNKTYGEKIAYEEGRRDGFQAATKIKFRIISKGKVKRVS